MKPTTVSPTAIVPPSMCGGGSMIRHEAGKVRPPASQVDQPPDMEATLWALLDPDVCVGVVVRWFEIGATP